LLRSYKKKSYVFTNIHFPSVCIMATCHGAGACGTGTNATYDTACLLLATGDEQCASSTRTRRDPTSWSEGRNLVLVQEQGDGADEGRGQLRRLAS
jgi:hypothetical protein